MERRNAYQKGDLCLINFKKNQFLEIITEYLACAEWQKHDMSDGTTREDHNLLKFECRRFPPLFFHFLLKTMSFKKLHVFFFFLTFTQNWWIFFSVEAKNILWSWFKKKRLRKITSSLLSSAAGFGVSKILGVPQYNRDSDVHKRL